PNTKGNVGEKILVNLWPQYFGHDEVKWVSNAGNEDLMVTPYWNSGVNNYGEKISIERKTGKQTYSGTHFKAAVDHAIDKDASYAMLIYDTEENLSKVSLLYSTPVERYYSSTTCGSKTPCTIQCNSST